MTTTDATAELHLVIDTVGADAHGYGYAWPSKVRQVVAGTLVDDAILLNTFPDPSLYSGHFKCCGPEAGVDVRFRKRANLPAALQGFIARDGTIWEIVGVAP